MQIELKKLEKYIDIYDIFRLLKKENNNLKKDVEL